MKKKAVSGSNVNVLFSVLTPARKNITFAASTLKQKSYAERKSSAPSMVSTMTSL